MLTSANPVRSTCFWRLRGIVELPGLGQLSVTTLSLVVSEPTMDNTALEIFKMDGKICFAQISQKL